MKKVISIKGDMGEIQSSVDLYIQLNSLGKFKSLEEFRKSIITGFMDSYKEREAGRVFLVNPSVDLSNGVSGVGESARDRVLETDVKVVETEVEVLEKVEGNVEEAKVEAEDWVEPEVEDIAEEKEEIRVVRPDIEYVSSGIILDDEDVADAIDTIEEVEEPEYGVDVEYVSHGIYLEESDKVIEGTTDTEYISHGIILEEGTDEVEEDYEESIEIVEEPEDQEYQEEVFDFDEEPNEPEVSEGHDVIEKPEVAKDEVTVEKNTSPPPVQEYIPRDIRDYVRGHLGIEISELVKVYPKKEIEKQIQFGRLYKKKGKIYI